MSRELFSSARAAQELGISVSTLYGWLGRSRAGEFEVRGQRMTINYLQGGPRGQGRIYFEESEIERLRDAMRVQPHPVPQRRLPTKQKTFPGINVPLGRPD